MRYYLIVRIPIWDKGLKQQVEKKRDLLVTDVHIIANGFQTLCLRTPL